MLKNQKIDEKEIQKQKLVYFGYREKKEVLDRNYSKLLLRNNSNSINITKTITNNENINENNKNNRNNEKEILKNNNFQNNEDKISKDNKQEINDEMSDTISIIIEDNNKEKTRRLSSRRRSFLKGNDVL